jgi:hypothetical protein
VANLIEQRVDLARRGQNRYMICRLPSGWLVIGDVQPLPGYCVMPAWVGYDWPTSRPFDPVTDRDFVLALRSCLTNLETFDG